MDTAKAANLFVNYPEADLFEFINAPIGKGTPISKKLSPLICSEFTNPLCHSLQADRMAQYQQQLWACLIYRQRWILTDMTKGTGSETTGTAILDIPSKKFKTGIASRALKPTLGIVDVNNTATCPKEVSIAAGLDVLFHSLESQFVRLSTRYPLTPVTGWTAVPFNERSPRPTNPIQRR
jgi:hydroxyacid-oxoacid transhydrogenase